MMFLFLRKIMYGFFSGGASLPCFESCCYLHNSPVPSLTSPICPFCRRMNYWKQRGRWSHYAWHSCSSWLRAARCYGRQSCGKDGFTSSCRHASYQRGQKRVLCPCWNMLKKCLSAVTSSSASRRIDQIEVTLFSVFYSFPSFFSPLPFKICGHLLHSGCFLFQLF